MSFSESLWTAIAPIREAIDRHPFLTMLEEGRLSETRFRYFMVQDSMFLTVYGRALASACAQCDNQDEIVFWANAARTAVALQRQLHERRVPDLGRAITSPTCTAHTSYLLALAGGGCYPALASGLLPSFWIYTDVATRMKRRLGDLSGHPYGDWIEAYCEPTFDGLLEEAQALADTLAGRANLNTMIRMSEAFVTAAKYEWMGWDAAQYQERWPV